MTAKTFRAGAAMLLVGVLFTAGCRKGGAAQGPGHGQPSAPLVTVVPVTAQEIIEWDEFTGRTAAMAAVVMSPGTETQVGTPVTGSAIEGPTAVPMRFDQSMPLFSSVPVVWPLL